MRLRGVMFASFGEPIEGDWRDRCRRALLAGLAERTLVAYVVDAPDGEGLASGAVAVLERRLPSPTRRGDVWHLSSMATDPRWRRRGLARAVVLGLLGWCAEHGAARVTLAAASDAEPLYRSLGFTDPHNPQLTWSAPTVS